MLAINGLDHVRVLGRDLESMKDLFRALGFAVPPRGDNFGHPLGSWQTVARFRDAFYLEFLSIKDPEKARTGRPEMMAFLARAEGGHSVVLNVPSASHVSEALRAKGLAATAPVTGSFLPEDQAGPLSEGWWLVNFESAPFRRELLSFIEYRQPWDAQTGYSAALPVQPNGVTGGRAVWIAVPDAKAALAHFERIGLKAARKIRLAAMDAEAHEILVAYGQSLLLIERPGAACVCGVSLLVESRSVESCAAKLGVESFWHSGAFGECFVIPADKALGITLEFIQAESQP